MYEVKALALTPQKAEKIFNEMLKLETFFNDYQKACSEACGKCDLCQRCKVLVARTLTALDAMVWEVWKDTDLVGIFLLTDIVPGHTANFVMTFWDGKLSGKAEITERFIQHVFKELQLHRLTIETPVYMNTAVKWVVRNLGFAEEGRKREAQLWRGAWKDVIMLGRLNGCYREF